MNIATKTILFVLLPMLIIMGSAGAWNHFHGRGVAREQADRQLNAAAQLTSRLVQRHIDQINHALESILVQQHLDEYTMFQQVGLLDEAEDARLWVEVAMERLADANPEVTRIECYSSDGERFVAVVDGQRRLSPASAVGETWFEQTQTLESYQGFESGGLLRLARSRKSEHGEETIAVVSILFDFKEGANQASQFATRHLDEVEIQITNSAGLLQFQHGDLPEATATRSAQAPLESLGSRVHIRQTSRAALASFNAGQRVLSIAMILVTCGLLVVGVLGTLEVTRSLRVANRRTDEANHQLTIHAEELEQAHHHLEEKTEQLATQGQELAKANEDLVRSNKDLNDFARVASHDLQAPLRAIIGFAQLLEDDYREQLDDRGREWIEHIVGGTERMETLIEDLLAYSRVETRAQAPKPTDFNDVVEGAVQLLQAPIQEASAVVTADELPTLPVDRSQMTQLLQNLIGNAVKYHGDQAPKVKVSAQRNGSSWVFAVADNGIGIDPKHHNRVFEIFKRLHTQDSYPGTGIGLAVCRKVVERHGGKIWIESKPGLGSTFFFSLPDRPLSENHE